MVEYHPDLYSFLILVIGISMLIYTIETHRSLKNECNSQFVHINFNILTIVSCLLVFVPISQLVLYRGCECKRISINYTVITVLLSMIGLTSSSMIFYGIETEKECNTKDVKKYAIAIFTVSFLILSVNIFLILRKRQEKKRIRKANYIPLISE